MSTEKIFTSTCRCCNYYSPEGRRGGICQQLGVPVKGCWKACRLATHPFAHSSWQNWDAEIVHLEHSLSLSCPEENAELTTKPAIPVAPQTQTQKT